MGSASSSSLSSCNIHFTAATVTTEAATHFASLSSEAEASSWKAARTPCTNSFPTSDASLETISSNKPDPKSPKGPETIAPAMKMLTAVTTMPSWLRNDPSSGGNDDDLERESAPEQFLVDYLGNAASIFGGINEGLKGYDMPGQVKMDRQQLPFFDVLHVPPISPSFLFRAHRSVSKSSQSAYRMEHCTVTHLNHQYGVHFQQSSRPTSRMLWPDLSVLTSLLLK